MTSGKWSAKYHGVFRFSIFCLGPWNGAVIERARKGRNVVYVTTGCALALVIQRQHTHARSFPVIKNHRQWWTAGFAEGHTTALQSLAEKLALRLRAKYTARASM